ncbi:MAG: O-antigen ligase family protein [Anaerolineae bacterium]
MTKNRLNSLIRFEWLFWTSACLSAVFLSPGTNPILFTSYFLALPLFAALRYATDRPILPPNKSAIPLIGILIIVLLSAAITPDIQFSLRKISGLINSIGLFTALLTSAPSQQKIPTWLLLFSGIAIAGAGAVGSDIYARIPILFPFFELFYLIVPLLPNVQRVINANLIAGALLWTLPVTAGLLVYNRKNGSILTITLAALSLSIQGFLLIIMQSRAALLAILLAGCWSAWLQFNRARHLIVTVGLVCIGIITLLVLPIWPASVQAGLQDSYFNLLVKGDEGERGSDSLDARVKIWRRAVEKISEKPVTGHGLNIFRKIANQPAPILNSAKEIPHAHNWTLQIILELGLIGLFFYAWLMLAACQHLWISWRLKGAKRPIIAGYAAALLAFTLFGLLDTISPGARPDFIFWVLLAGAFSLGTDQPENLKAN